MSIQRLLMDEILQQLIFRYFISHGWLDDITHTRTIHVWYIYLPTYIWLIFRVDVGINIPHVDANWWICFRPLARIFIKTGDVCLTKSQGIPTPSGKTGFWTCWSRAENVGAKNPELKACQGCKMTYSKFSNKPFWALKFGVSNWVCFKFGSDTLLATSLTKTLCHQCFLGILRLSDANLESWVSCFISFRSWYYGWWLKSCTTWDV